MFEYETDLVHYSDLFLAATRLLGSKPLPNDKFLNKIEGVCALFKLGDTIRPLSLAESKALFAEASLVTALLEFGPKAMSLKATNPLPPISLVVTAVTAVGNIAKLCGCAAAMISAKIKTELEAAGRPNPKEIAFAVRDMTLCAVAAEFNNAEANKVIAETKIAADVANFDLGKWNPGQDAKLN